MSFGRTCTGLYSKNIEECVDVFCKILLPAAGLRYFRSRSRLPHELDFHKEQAIELIQESELPDSQKAELILRLERSYDNILSWAGCKNA